VLHSNKDVALFVLTIDFIFVKIQFTYCWICKFDRWNVLISYLNVLKSFILQ